MSQVEPTVTWDFLVTNRLGFNPFTKVFVQERPANTGVLLGRMTAPTRSFHSQEPFHFTSKMPCFFPFKKNRLKHRCCFPNHTLTHQFMTILDGVTSWNNSKNNKHRAPISCFQPFFSGFYSPRVESKMEIKDVTVTTAAWISMASHQRWEATRFLFQFFPQVLFIFLGDKDHGKATAFLFFSNQSVECQLLSLIF